MDVVSSMNVNIFWCHINVFKILLKFSHNIESVLSSLILLSHKSAIFSPLDLARFQDCFTYISITIWHHLFLEFSLVDTWFFAHWRHQRVVTRLQNIRQLNIRRVKNFFRTRTSRDGVNTTLATDFLTCLREKIFLCSEQLKQSFLFER